MTDKKWPANGGSIASRETDKGIMVRDADNEPMRPLDATVDDSGLLPCPFCGEKPLIRPDCPAIEGNAWTKIFCDCVVEPSITVHEDNTHFETAKRLWNTRAQPQAVAGGDEPMRDVVYYGVQNTKHHYIGKDKHGFYVFETSQWAGQPYSGYKENWKTELSLQMKVIPQPEAAKVALDALNDIEEKSKFRSDIHPVQFDKIRFILKYCNLQSETGIPVTGIDTLKFHSYREGFIRLENGCGYLVDISIPIEFSALQTPVSDGVLDGNKINRLIESADWLENCADMMDEESLDRENHSRHFRVGAKAIRATLKQSTAKDGVGK